MNGRLTGLPPLIGPSAGRLAPQLQVLGFATPTLPPTSPANASWGFERKLAAWREGLAVR